MINQEQENRLRTLWNFVATYEPLGKTRREFWAAYQGVCGSLGDEAWADDADEELHERYIQVMALTDDLGFMAPKEDMDVVME